MLISEELLKINTVGVGENSVVEIQIKDFSIVDYQIEMINQNRNSLLISVNKQLKNEGSELVYNTKGLLSLKDYLVANKINKGELLDILGGICNVIADAKDYYLIESNFILSEKTIFIDDKTKEVKLIYLPVDGEYSKNINEDFKEITKKIIIDLAIIEDNASDNYLQVILNEIKSPQMTIKSFMEVVLELREDRRISQEKIHIYNDQMPVNKPISSQSVNNNMNINSKNIESKYEDNYENEFIDRKYVYSKIRIMIFGIAQVVFIGAAIFCFLEVYRYEPLKKSILVGLVVALDLLIAVLIFDSSKKKEVIINNNIPEIDNGKTIISEDVPSSNSVDFQKKDLSIDANLDTDILKLRLPYLLFSNGEVVERINISKDVFTLGRLDTMVDYVIENSAVGKKHAEIVNKNGKYYLKDLYSKNGTFLNGEKISPEQEYLLKDNDEIILANMAMHFKF